MGMTALIDDLLAENPDGLSVRLIADGQPYAGAIRRTKYGGVYEMVMMVQLSPNARPQPIPIFVAGDKVSGVTVVTDDMSQTVEPANSGLILPRH